ncbi:hypothetical protein DO021_15310 [Desulfobacter hydrogenophilus]|uniref:Uncharacterized protein n=1 Tax=Desulfobacter hydrogenophilus TaxID=2291 RepID=A0A328FDQ6_9BACT|nr:hypothetical protein [Desulfobacter hydrogenophilus]NDY72867.1 hypothetical protein [Desulfobacter hydrogenophilus]QBH13600.1 hypothetical protein EYB58_12095 [Desulfobacter hydrogenophilus]RAM01175.1 hypothetical protein DO021_15310 [Desulfobacter hydrogenophilus]
MNKDDYLKADLQRRFQKEADNFVLLHKNGLSKSKRHINRQIVGHRFLDKLFKSKLFLTSGACHPDMKQTLSTAGFH